MTTTNTSRKPAGPGCQLVSTTGAPFSAPRQVIGHLLRSVKRSMSHPEVRSARISPRLLCAGPVHRNSPAAASVDSQTPSISGEGWTGQLTTILTTTTPLTSATTAQNPRYRAWSRLMPAPGSVGVTDSSPLGRQIELPEERCPKNLRLLNVVVGRLIARGTVCGT